MQRHSSLACMALLSLAFATPAAADGPSFALRSFIGLWEGIDPVDGGNSLRSITCSRDRRCELGLTDSVITLCGGGPAFARGTGGIEGKALVFPDTVLTCPDGRQVNLVVSFEHDPFNRTLVETAVVEGERTLPNIIFHRISR